MRFVIEKAFLFVISIHNLKPISSVSLVNFLIHLRTVICSIVT